SSLNVGSGTITSGDINGQTITASANFTGNLTVATGIGITSGGLTVTADGADITGGIDNNSGGITNTGTISGATIDAGSNTISNLTNANLSGSAGITNANLANSSLTVTAGTGLSGGGSV